MPLKERKRKERVGTLVFSLSLSLFFFFFEDFVHQNASLAYFILLSLDRPAFSDVGYRGMEILE